MRNRWWYVSVGAFATVLVTLVVAVVAGQQQSTTTDPDEFRVNPSRGPVDLGLTDRVLVGAIDVHAHVDPDAPGSGNQVRGIDAFDFGVIAKSRGMRGFVFKTHQDPGSAQVAYLVREHVAPGLEVFGRMALNMATGGINVASVEHLAQIKGGWGRIVEMPTRDSENSTRNETPESMERNRPWMLLMPQDAPKFVSVSRSGELLPEVKYLIDVMAKVRTVDSNGPLVLATGHSSPEEHLMLAREGRRRGLQVILTHPGNIPQLPEVAKLGAFIEMNASGIYRNVAGARAAVEMIRKIGAESIVIGTDCGQMGNPYPSDCLVLAARRLRALGISDSELDLMIKHNAAKLLGLSPLEQETLPPSAATRR
jgi:hypothetical protein